MLQPRFISNQQRGAVLDIQNRIEEGRAAVESLLLKESIPFLSPTVDQMPDKSGVYLFSEKRTGRFLYIGRSEVLKNRMKDHWDGTTSSDLSRRLVKEGKVASVPSGREWIKDNVVIRWVTRDELNLEIKWAEYFAIGILRPDFNK